MLFERARGGRCLWIRVRVFRHRRAPSRSPHQCAAPERCGSPLVSLSKRDGGGREEDVEKLGIGGTNARRSRTGRQGKSHLRTSWSICRQVPALPISYDCKVWPASVQLHAPPFPAECETGQSDSVVASYMSKIASECSSLCCCTRLVKRKKHQKWTSITRHGMGAFQSGKGTGQSLHRLHS